MPRYLVGAMPWWLVRTNTVVCILTVTPAVLLGHAWTLALWMAWVLGVFVWGYRSWRAAGSPAFDEPQRLEFWPATLKSLWPERDQK
ncbi:MAG TPA: hypothetical protein VM348_10490 [Brevundimonas sp.]|nr:hypothetical protein [Brevundimonas sp.]